jgi:hypothetical protein
MLELDIPPVFLVPIAGVFADGENQLELSQNLIPCTALKGCWIPRTRESDFIR